jgi:hypothetical protein
MDKLVTPAPRFPADICDLLKWSNVIRRVISVSKSGGYGVVSIRVVVDSEGNPVQWAEPILTKLEPKRESVEVITQLIANLTG